MDERKAAILKALIEEYVETGQPVGSGTVAREASLGVSSATVPATQLRDASFADLPSPRATADAATDELVGQARDALAARFTAGRQIEPVFIGGASRIAADLDAFAAGETVGRLLEVLEHQYLVVSLVRDLIDQGVTVRIGAENRLEDLRERSVVLARFDIEGRAAGTVGVLGPTRMNYPQAMAAVAAVSRRLGERLSPPG